MNKSLRSLLSLSGQSVAYGVGFYSKQVVVYLTLPLLTSLMTQEEYGIVSIVTPFYQVLNTLTNVGLPLATFRLYNDSDDESYQQKILGSSQALFFTLAVLAALVLCLFSREISNILLGSQGYSQVIQIVAILLVLETMNYYGSLLLRLYIRPGLFGIHSVVFVVSQMGLAILFIKFLDLGIVGYWLGYLIGGVISLLLMIWFNRKYLVFKFSWQHAKELLQYGLPLIPTALSVIILQLADRYTIRYFVDLEAVAIYSIGYKIGSVVNLVLAPFSIAWPQFAFTTMNKPDARKVYRDVLTYLLMGSIFIALITFVFRNQLIALVSPDSYQAAANIVPLITISMILYGINPILTLGPKIKKHTKPLAWMAITTTLINIILLFVFIPIQGIKGAGTALLFSSLFLTVVSYFVGRRYYQFPLDKRRITIIIIAAGLTAAAGGWISPEIGNQFALLLIKALILLLYPLILIFLGFMPLKQIGQIISSGSKEIINWIKIKDRPDF
jgi:O-antigen/teichoic acid export membrane protein